MEAPFEGGQGPRRDCNAIRHGRNTKLIEEFVKNIYVNFEDPLIFE